MAVRGISIILILTTLSVSIVEEIKSKAGPDASDDIFAT